jgi:hypothetical protein
MGAGYGYTGHSGRPTGHRADNPSRPHLSEKSAKEGGFTMI